MNKDKVCCVMHNEIEIDKNSSCKEFVWKFIDESKDLTLIDKSEKIMNCGNCLFGLPDVKLKVLQILKILRYRYPKGKYRELNMNEGELK